MLVMKFGGTSVGDAKCFAIVKDIVARAARDQTVGAVVVSAMSTVTETLLSAARLACAGDQKGVEEKLQYLEQKHLGTIDALFSGARRDAVRAKVLDVLGEFRRICGGMALLSEMPRRSMDAGVSVGERMSSIILANYMDEQGIPAEAVDAVNCVITDDNFCNAKPLTDLTRDALRNVALPLIEKKRIAVITGFLGGTRDGIRTTLGRGGSDYSAAIVADALEADELWIWTDVDGVLSADPKMVGEAAILDELTYEEASELSHFGAKVLHHKTLRPLLNRTIPVYIKNTFAPEKRGTRIGPPHAGIQQGAKSVTSMTPVTLLTVRSIGGPGTTELLARTFAALDHSQVEILMVTQSSYQDSFSLLVPQNMAERASAALENAFRLELNHNYLEPLTAQHVTAIALIGEGMRGIPGVAARLFGSLAKERINIIAIAQGSSESNISLVVSVEDRGAAVRAIHREFISPAEAEASSPQRTQRAQR
ncbi:MAG: aspartate kinase [Acidobacteria bacterium]|nr:aspartate kinase [Acidobacteriota bacterium]